MIEKRQWYSLVKRSVVTLVTAGAATGALLAHEGEAQAQARFGDKGQLAISAENLFSLGTERYGDTVVNVDNAVTINRFGFLYSQCGVSPRCPQVGGTYFILPSLSLGATLGYESRGGSQTSTPMNGIVTTMNLPDESSFVFLPKVGYAFMFGQVVGIWLRGGPGYFHESHSRFATSTHSYWLLSGDADLVVSPFQHFAFYVGPQFDISFAGSRTDTNNQGAQSSWDASYRDIGVGLGLIGYVDL